MRVLMLCADPGIAPDGTKGASVHLRSLSGALARSGHEVTLLARRPPATPESVEVPVAVLDGPCSIVRAAAQHGVPDVVYERYSLGHLGGLEAARALRRPFVLEVNAPLVAEARQHRPQTLQAWHAAAESRLLRKADFVVAVSEPLRRWVAAVRGSDDGTAVVPNGCDPRLYPSPAAVGAASGVLVFLGHPKPWHGADALVPLLALLVEEGYDPRLLVIGGGDGAAQVLRDARRRGVESRVEVTGPVPQDEAAARLAGATVALAPYPAHELFYFCPLKVVEYMAAGLPVVATTQGDIPALVGSAGILVAAGDGNALCAAVGGLLADPRRRLELGRVARRRALARYTWDAVARTVAALVGERKVV